MLSAFFTLRFVHAQQGCHLGCKGLHIALRYEMFTPRWCDHFRSSTDPIRDNGGPARLRFKKDKSGGFGSTVRCLGGEYEAGRATHPLADLFLCCASEHVN